MLSSKPKRILQIVGSMNRGGAETMVLNLYRCIDKDKYQFDFVYFTNEQCHYDEEIVTLGGTIHRIVPSKKIPTILLQFYRGIKLFKLLKSHNYSAIHAHTLYSIGLHLFVSKLAGLKTRIAHSHNTSDKGKSFGKEFYYFISKWLIKKCSTKMIACGRDAGNYLFGYDFDRNVEVLPNAVDFHSFNKDKVESKMQLCKELNISEKTILIGQIGTFSIVKNHNFTIKLANYLKEREIEFHMLFAGTGKLVREIQDLVDKCKLNDHVSLLGVRSDIPNIMSAIDIFFMPSFHEGLPVSIIEAQAAGTKCIVSSAISKEADLGLGLVSNLNLDSPLEEWYKAIIANKNKVSIQSSTRLKAFTERGYEISSSVKKLQSIYGQSFL